MVPVNAQKLDLLVAEAQERFGAAALWWLRPGLDHRHAKVVARGLYREGNAEARALAGQLEGAIDAAHADTARRDRGHSAQPLAA